MDDAGKIRANKWRQGCVLLPDELPDGVLEDLSLPSLNGEFLFYVLTHDCDLVQADFTKEPTAELLLITQVASPDGNLTHGKNSRVLEFSIGESYYRASCHDRYRIDRRLLAKVKPSVAHSNDPVLCDLICNWMTKRYIRPAFPDEFNNRLAREGRAIRKWLKRHGNLFEQILLACSPLRDELADDEDYRLSVWLVLNELGSEPVDPIKAQEIVVEFEQLLNGCRGVDVLDCRVVLESEVSLAHLRVMSTWDFDYLTYRERSDAS